MKDHPLKDLLIAAEQGDAMAQNNLGECYASGNGVPQDDEEAITWFRKAAEQEHVVETPVELLHIKHLQQLKDKATSGDAAAQYHLGFCYTYSWEILDIAKAAAWYQKAAAQGHAKAQFRLGECYSNGEGVPHDAAQAAAWFQKAAEQGHAAAENNLGVSYASGRGVPQDDAQAVAWFRKAAEQGYAKAVTQLRERAR